MKTALRIIEIPSCFVSETKTKVAKCLEFFISLSATKATQATIICGWEHWDPRLSRQWADWTRQSGNETPCRLLLLPISGTKGLSLTALSNVLWVPGNQAQNTRRKAVFLQYSCFCTIPSSARIWLPILFSIKLSKMLRTQETSPHPMSAPLLEP